jgi:hypothetical protein
MGLLLCWAMLLGGALAAEAEDELRFNEDGRFKIMVIADVQDSLKPSPYAEKLITAALAAESPDLVVLTGDNIFGMAPALFFSESNTMTAIDNVLAPIVEAGVPFCVVMGNHDSEGSTPRLDQMLHYMQNPLCLAQVGDAQTGVGNYNVLLYDQAGQAPVLNLYFMDSGVTAPEGGYAYVQADQIAWYEQTTDALAAERGGEVLPAMLFQHIPVPEIYSVLTEVSKDTPGAVQGTGAWKGKFYTANPEYVSAGSLGEGPCPPNINNGQFDSWTQKGDVFAAFFGHDHQNDFVAHWQGIDLVYSPGVGFYSYGNGYEHGVRVIELSQDDVRDYSTRMVYYKDVVDGEIPYLLQYIGALYVQLAIAGGVVVVVLGVGAWLIARRIRRKRKKVVG